MKKILIFLIFSVSWNICISQVESSIKRKDVLEQYGLLRGNLEFYIIWGLDNSHLGASIRFSNNWYFTPENKNRWYFRTNWLMGGLVFEDGLFIPSAPLNIGIGDNIQFSQEVSLDISISGGGSSLRARLYE